MDVTIIEGKRRTFTITVGLHEGYGESGIVHHPSTADKVVSEWMEDRVRKNLLAVSGFFTEIKLHYVRTEVETTLPRYEPGLRFWGEVSIQRLDKVSDTKVIEAVNDLAGTLRKALGQVHVTVSYRDRTWVRGDKTS